MASYDINQLRTHVFYDTVHFQNLGKDFCLMLVIKLYFQFISGYIPFTPNIPYFCQNVYNKYVRHSIVYV